MAGNEFAGQFTEFLTLIDREIRAFEPNVSAPLFYDPIHYVLDLKGKRIRPLLTLLSAEAAGGESTDALAAAAAVELLHNFTLVHDDIMDKDDLRRGLPTVHRKWDVATAILAGDGLMGLAFQKLLQAPRGDRLVMMERMVKTMIIICEGQALDKTFEQEKDIKPEAYLDMITRKTAVLIELACELGGRSVDAGEEVIRELRTFGHNLGMGFQIQDDLLDIMAEEKKLGKKVGSDLIMHKQTLLTIRLKERTRRDDFYDLKLSEFRTLVAESGVAGLIEAEANRYFSAAFSALQNLPAGLSGKLVHLAELIRDRRW